MLEKFDLDRFETCPNGSYGCANSLDGLETFNTLFVSCPNYVPSWGRLGISIRLSRSEIREVREV